MQRRITIAWIVLVAVALAALPSCGTPTSTESIKIGVIASITGSIPAVGQSTVNAANLATGEINDAGGLEVGGRKIKVELVIEDDQDRKEAATSSAKKLINQDGVVAIIGPQASRNAIPAAAVAEAAQIPLLSPWSTNPETTAGKKYVFRTAFIDPFQGRVMARFAIEQLNANSAAVLFDTASEYNRGIAEFFRQVFQDAGGQIVAFESYTTGEQDFETQLAIIQAAKADVLFLPNYYNEVPMQVRQAHEAGVTATIIGSDSWGQITPEALADMEGLFFSTHYAADAASPAAKEFIAAYQAAYDTLPDDVAALTYDAFGMLFQAIVAQGTTDPESIRNGLASIGRYEGVTGSMEYQGAGDPVKSAVILQIKGGKFQYYTQAEP